MTRLLPSVTPEITNCLAKGEWTTHNPLHSQTIEQFVIRPLDQSTELGQISACCLDCAADLWASQQHGQPAWAVPLFELTDSQLEPVYRAVRRRLDDQKEWAGKPFIVAKMEVL